MGSIAKWTFEACKKEALKYKTRVEFKRKSGSAYNSAKKNKWLDKICGHMVSGSINKGLIWTFEACKKEALKYKTRVEFKTKARGSYNAALRNQWLDKLAFVCGSTLWTFEACKKEAFKYKTRKEFQTKAGGAYSAACKNGWLDKICGNMVSTINLREKKLQNKIYKQLQRQYKDLEIKMEVKIPKRDNLAGRIDFTIKNPTNGKFIGLELKHSESYWSQKECKAQISKYNRAFRERKGFKGVYLVSNNGSIGKSIDIIPKLINKIL